MSIRLLHAVMFFLGLGCLGMANAGPLAPEQVPEPLAPWVGWALHGATELDCPYRYNGAERACRWPSRLTLQLGEEGGAFTQQWQVFAEIRVRLPGDRQHWPQSVTDGQGKALLVEAQDGLPHVRLPPGIHTMNGQFLWKKLPKTLRVTPESGLIGLTVNGQAIRNPQVNDKGQLWLTQGKAEAASEDDLDIQVFRKLSDSHPIQVQTMIRLRVSGKQRNVTLGPVLLDGFITLELNSPLPVRMQGSQQLQVQLRPGEWALNIIGRAKSNQAGFALPASEEPWPDQEVWVFATDSDMRQVEVEGVNSIDPNQTRLPDEWKTLPAYLLSAGQTMDLHVVQRGAAQTSKQQLTLEREAWLDFAGTGYTFKDQLRGNIQQQTRLDVLPELMLGRVSIDGQPQFITRHQEDGAAGVEIRSSQLNLEAESRYEGDIASLPANGWRQDLQQVNTSLHLPSGWRLFFADGMDNLPDSWVQGWTLLDVFLVLITAVASAYLFGWFWGGFALVTLAFIWQEPDAPRFIWLNLLAVIALLRVLPQGMLQSMVNTYRWLSVLALALIVLPYLLDTVRVSLYPQLNGKTDVQRFVEATGEAGIAAEMMMGDAENRMARSRVAPAPMQKQAYPGKPLSSIKRKKYDMKAIDPNSMIQTGPGLPDWRSYQTVYLSWSGPVKAGETGNLWLMGSGMNSLFKILGLLLLLVFAWRMLHQQRSLGWSLPKDWQQCVVKAAPLLLLPALLLPADGVRADAEVHPEPPPLVVNVDAAKPLPPASSVSVAGFPDEPLLHTLQERLLETPDCLPQCAQIESMNIILGAQVMRARLLVHASVDTTIPLPGSQVSWLPGEILLDGAPAQALARDKQQQLWVALPAGLHTVELNGLLPARNSIPLPLPLRPHHVSWVAEDGSWTLDGVRDNGSPESQLQLNRARNNGGQLRPEQEQMVLPAFVKIERQLHLGLDWHVETIVTRLAPMDSPLSLDIPLLPDEQLMSDSLSVRQQRVRINLAAQQQQARWSSRLNPSGQIVLQAAQTVDYLETWQVAASPVWHVEAEGLPVNRFLQEDDTTVPVWQPWPGEQLVLKVSRPQGIPGQTVTVLGSEMRVSTGKRVNDVGLKLNIRSSRGVQHRLRLPADAEVQSLTVGGVAQRIQPSQGAEDGWLNLSLKPGSQEVNVQWRELHPMGLHYRFPAVDVGLPSVNARAAIAPPAERWLLWVNGPAMGPAVLFWGVLLALLLVSLALGYSRLTPLKSWQWFLLAVGLSQTEPFLMIIVVGWLLALALREKHQWNLKYWQFDLMQFMLAGLTLVALMVLVISLSKGLLGMPEMQIAGNMSSAYNLNWYQDRSGQILPQPSVVSVPLWIYRVLMLLWALWLAVAVLGWLRWGWQAMNVGGLWQSKPKMAVAPPAAVDGE